MGEGVAGGGDRHGENPRHDWGDLRVVAYGSKPGMWVVRAGRFLSRLFALLTGLGAPRYPYGAEPATRP